MILGYLARPAVLGELAGHAGATFGRVLLAVILGSLPGLLLGMLLGWSRPLHAALGPLLAAAHPVPKIAILPLIMIVFGIGDASIVVTAALGAFFPVLINTLAGVQQINPIHFDVARNYGAGRLKMFARVVLPGSLPLVLTGLLLALNVTLLMTLAVEMVSAREGLGAMIWQAWHTMRTEELYASLAVITVSGVLINSLFHRLARALAPWQAGAKGRLS